MPKLVRPAQPIIAAAKGARDRLIATLKDMSGEDAKRLRRGVNATINMIDRFANGDIELRQPMPHGVQRNPTTSIERRVMAFWKATDLLQDRIFDHQTNISEAMVIAAFDAIT